MAKGLVDMLLKDPTITAASKIVSVIQLSAADLLSPAAVQELLFGADEKPAAGTIRAESVKCCSDKG